MGKYFPETAKHAKAQEFLEAGSDGSYGLRG